MSLPPRWAALSLTLNHVAQIVQSITIDRRIGGGCFHRDRRNKVSGRLSVGAPNDLRAICTFDYRRVENPARLLAVVGVLTIMTGMAILFYVVSSQTKSVFHKKTIQIAGIGSTVYLGLTVTPMHDLMVSIALVFFLVLMFAVLHMVYFENHFRLFLIGMVCLGLQLGGAVIYYGKLFLEVLPLVQKTSLVLTVVWLLGVQFRKQGKVLTV